MPKPELYNDFISSSDNLRSQITISSIVPEKNSPELSHMVPIRNLSTSGYPLPIPITNEDFSPSIKKDEVSIISLESPMVPSLTIVYKCHLSSK